MKQYDPNEWHIALRADGKGYELVGPGGQRVKISGITNTIEKAAKQKYISRKTVLGTEYEKFLEEKRQEALKRGTLIHEQTSAVLSKQRALDLDRDHQYTINAINDINRVFPAKDGWEIKSEVFLSDYQKYATQADIIALNTRTKQAVIIDIKTGKAHPFQNSMQLSIEARWAKQKYPGYNFDGLYVYQPGKAMHERFTPQSRQTDTQIDRVLYSGKRLPFTIKNYNDWHLRNMNAGLPKGVKRRLPLESNLSQYTRSITLFDIETGPGDQVLSVAAIKGRINKNTGRFEVEDTHERYYKPIGKFSQSQWLKYIELHGLTPKVLSKLRDQVSARNEQLIQKLKRQGADYKQYGYLFQETTFNQKEQQYLKDFFEGSVVIGHNLPFDYSRTIGRNWTLKDDPFGSFYPDPDSAWNTIDTLALAEFLNGKSLSGEGRNKLGTLYKMVTGRKLVGAHGAMADAYALAALAEYFYGREGRLGDKFRYSMNNSNIRVRSQFWDEVEAREVLELNKDDLNDELRDIAKEENARNTDAAASSLKSSAARSVHDGEDASDVEHIAFREEKPLEQMDKEDMKEMLKLLGNTPEARELVRSLYSGVGPEKGSGMGSGSAQAREDADVINMSTLGAFIYEIRGLKEVIAEKSQKNNMKSLLAEADSLIKQGATNGEILANFKTSRFTAPAVLRNIEETLPLRRSIIARGQALKLAEKIETGNLIQHSGIRRQILARLDEDGTFYSDEVRNWQKIVNGSMSPEARRNQKWQERAQSAYLNQLAWAEEVGTSRIGVGKNAWVDVESQRDYIKFRQSLKAARTGYNEFQREQAKAERWELRNEKRAHRSEINGTPFAEAWRSLGSGDWAGAQSLAAEERNWRALKKRKDSLIWNAVARDTGFEDAYASAENTDQIKEIQYRERQFLQQQRATERFNQKKEAAAANVMSLPAAFTKDFSTAYRLAQSEQELLRVRQQEIVANNQIIKSRNALYGSGWTGLSGTIQDAGNQFFAIQDLKYNEAQRVIGSTRGFLLPDFIQSPLARFATGVTQVPMIEKSRKQGLWNAIGNIAQVGMTGLGAVVGGLAGGVGAGPGAALGGLIGTGLKTGISSWASYKEGAIKGTSFDLQSFFNQWSGIFGLLMVPVRLLSGAFGLLTKSIRLVIPFFTNILKNGMNYINAWAVPDQLMTDVNWPAYQRLQTMDSAAHLSAGSSYNSMLSISTAGNQLFGLGQYNENQLVASAMLGMFGDFYQQGTMTEDRYLSMIDKAYARTSAMGARGETLLRMIDPNMAQTIQTMRDLGFTSAAELQSKRGMYYRDVSQDEYRTYRLAGHEYNIGMNQLQNTWVRAAGAIWNKFGKGLMNDLNEIADLVVLGDWQSAFNKLKDTISGLWESAKKWLSSKGFDTGSFGGFFESIKKKIQDALGGGVSAAFSTLWPSLKSGMTTFIMWTYDALMMLGNKAVDIFGRVITQLSDIRFSVVKDEKGLGFRLQMSRASRSNWGEYAQYGDAVGAAVADMANALGWGTYKGSRNSGIKVKRKEWGQEKTYDLIDILKDFWKENSGGNSGYDMTSSVGKNFFMQRLKQKGWTFYVQEGEQLIPLDPFNEKNPEKAGMDLATMMLSLVAAGKGENYILNEIVEDLYSGKEGYGATAINMLKAVVDKHPILSQRFGESRWNFAHGFLDNMNTPEAREAFRQAVEDIWKGVEEFAGYTVTFIMKENDDTLATVEAGPTSVKATTNEPSRVHLETTAVQGITSGGAILVQ